MNQLWDPVMADAGDGHGVAMVFQCNVYYWMADGSGKAVAGQGTFQKLRGSSCQFRLQVDGGCDSTVSHLYLPPLADWSINKTRAVQTMNGAHGPQRALVDVVMFVGSFAITKLQVTMPFHGENRRVAKLFRPALIHADQSKREAMA
ncbi:hypothetical protein SEMRO_1366_G266620.1 [Seminavis robusta]|uniref:Uncharacterized protein n=1 Tax=Seminavis robusta TaxID=568900 RepID=A0A9N8ELS8_9STRA|nr:hypothetical protein SEMRO_1366_G266620.1 [Seminavis robusta]|eukprot:Sro1366_g266620.1 n/a (147) ;mRNA; f:1608-2048